MDRREFLARASVAATWAGITIIVSGCSDDDEPTAPEDTGSTDVIGVVSGGGHTHSGARVTAAQLMAGDAIRLTLTGSGHTHTVDLDADQVMRIADGLRVTQTSSSDAGHTHSVAFNSTADLPSPPRPGVAP